LYLNLLDMRRAVADQAPSRCPQCNAVLRVSALHCPACDLVVSGDFPRCRFCELPAEQSRFLEVFLRCRGVIRHMEAELGLSYPTVRSRVDDLLKALRLDEEAQERQSIRDVLTSLEDGALSAGEAVVRIAPIREGQP
jgi:hypothetical protein